MGRALLRMTADVIDGKDIGTFRRLQEAGGGQRKMEYLVIVRADVLLGEKIPFSIVSMKELEGDGSLDSQSVQMYVSAILQSPTCHVTDRFISGSLNP